MKAVLVIELERVKGKYLCADENKHCPLWNTEKYICQYCLNTGEKHCPLKPLPYRYVEDKVEIKTSRDVKVCTYGVQMGRNMVINDILGEEEE